MSYDKDSLPPSYPIHYDYPLPMVPIPDLTNINDYLPWSIVNLFFGFGLFALMPLIFSIICRHHKSNNYISGAQTMSTLSLVFNILITIGGIIAWSIFIIYFPIYLATVNSLI